jgi:hypothetical protein
MDAVGELRDAGGQHYPTTLLDGHTVLNQSPLSW